MSTLDRLLLRPATWCVVVFLAVAVRLAFVLAPFDVLSPVDAHELGRRLFDGQLPYRDFALEYPPGALLAFVLPGLAPAAIAAQVLALQALLLDGSVLLLMRDDPGRFRRYVVLSTVQFPLLSGGFDALAMACIAWSTALLARDDRRGWWLAGIGAAIKLFPGVAWGWARRWGHKGSLVLAGTLVVLAAPMLLGSGRDVYVGYHVQRGVQQESIAASLTYIARRVTGHPIEVAYRFRAQELVGAEAVGVALLVVFAGLAVVLAARSRFAVPSPDPWLAAFALLMVVLCASKVLSPQFITLAAPLAAHLGGRWASTYLAMLALTIVAFLDDTKTGMFMSIVAARNVLFVGLAVAAAWRALRPRASRDQETDGPPDWDTVVRSARMS